LSMDANAKTRPPVTREAKIPMIFT
jgi:hypothetical protein